MILKDSRRERRKRQDGPPPADGETDPWGLKEKYFHSLGAALCEEGKFDEALEALKQALRYDDTPYGHYHLGVAFLGKKEYGAALDELTCAIERAPSTPEYYYERGLVRRAAGDHEGAASDLAKAVAIDGNYARIEEIREAVSLFRDALDDMGVAWLPTVRIRDARLRALADRVVAPLRSEYEAITHSSCPVTTCPAYCCHFTGPLARHGVVIGAWKLRAIKELLLKESLAFDDFVDRLPYHGETHVGALIPPPFCIKEGEDHSVFFPKRADAFIDASLLPDLPKGPDYQTLMWINERARPCIFLRGKRCMIHDAGDEAGLPACKQFLCLTGTVSAILNRLGLAEGIFLEGRTMAELNRIAAEGFLLLSKEVYGRGAALKLRRTRNKALKAVAEADKSEDEAGLAAKIEECRALVKEYEEAMESRKESARRAIEKLLSPPRAGASSPSA